MSYLKELSRGSVNLSPQKSQSFSLMKIFKRPAPVVAVPKPPRAKQQHPYVKNFRKQDNIRTREMEELIKQANMPLEERKLREQLAKGKRSFVKIQNGVEKRYDEKENQNQKGFAKVVNASWGTKRDQDKKKEQSKQKIKEILQLREKQRQISKSFNYSRQRSRNDKKSKIVKRVNSKKQQIPRIKQIVYRPEKRKQKKTNQTVYMAKREKQQKQDDYSQFWLDGFIDMREEKNKDEDDGLLKARKMYGKYYQDEYKQRDRQSIRESTVEELFREEKMSTLLAKKEEREEAKQEKKRQEQRKEKEKSKQRRKSKKN